MSETVVPEETPGGAASEPTPAPAPAPSGSGGRHRPAATWPLVLGALGIVYGDIGTSPLYALRECIAAAPEADLRLVVWGSLSLIVWSLVWIVCLKYIGFVTRADNKGEGGIFALLALTHVRPRTCGVGPFIVFVLAGAALLYGEGVITPAISVLSATEGLETISPDLAPAVPLVAAIILFFLFLFQKHGTGRIGRVFGPVMLVWFTTLGVLGLRSILAHPGVLQALNPWHALHFLVNQPTHATAILGSVVLAVTGVEALYADLGHFGRPAIVRGWFLVAMPGLLLNYFGQGALALSDPSTTKNLFFALAGDGPAKYFLVGLAFAATVIASQALISGAFSLMRQAMQLGYFPRLHLDHTNEEHEGQIYLPAVNWTLAVGSIALVFGFRSSAGLAAAYGIAVTGTMVITTLAFYHVARQRWHWSKHRALALCGAWLLVDLTFFIANLHKISDGGWVPLALGAVLLVVMHTWKVGRQQIVRVLQDREMPLHLLIDDVVQRKLYRSPGAAVFMAGRPDGVPVAMLHHLKCNHCIHETVVLLSFVTTDDPTEDKSDRLTLTELGGGFWRAVVNYGYMETPNAGAALELVRLAGVPLKSGRTTYFFNREIIVPTGKTPMPRWQKRLYAVLSRNAVPARDHYRIPPNQIVELGLPIQI